MICWSAGVVREVLESPLTFQVSAVIWGGRDMVGMGGAGVVVGCVDVGRGGSVGMCGGSVVGMVVRNCVMVVVWSLCGRFLCFLWRASLRLVCVWILGLWVCLVWGFFLRGSWGGNLCLVGLVVLVVGVGHWSMYLSCRCLSTSEGMEVEVC